MMPNLINPYIAGNPIRDPKHFFGREDIIKLISNELKNQTNNSWVLFGQRRIGKTSILFKLARDLDQNKYVTIYFDLQDKSSMLLGELLKDLSQTIAEKAGLSLPSEMNFDNKGINFQKVFLPWLFKKIDNNKKVIILMDEFDVLDEKKEIELHSYAAKKQLIPFLRRLISDETRLGFVFVIGRYPEQIKDKYNLGATFKASLTKEIWLLTKPETISLIRLAEQNKTLNYEEEAIHRIYALTHGHPYFTQLFCQRLWQKAYEQSDLVAMQIPTITEADVNNIIPDAMQVGSMGLRWIWDGLQPAEKLFASALAEIAPAEGEEVKASLIRDVLSNFEARLSPGTIEDAPVDLKERRIIEVVTSITSSEKAYSFSVEFFRLWIKDKLPLHQVKTALDEEDRIANSHFIAGYEYYGENDWKNALDNFEKAINKNPHHFNATLYKGKTLIQMSYLTQAYNFFQRAYKLDAIDARESLLDILKILIERSKDDNNIWDSLKYCDEYLKIAPKTQEVENIQRSLWEYKANQLFAQQNWAAAYHLFKKAKVKNYNERFSQISISQWLQNAEIALENGFLEDVLVAYEQAGQSDVAEWLRSSPNEAISYYKLAEFYEATKRYDLAKKCLLRIRESDTNVVPVLFRIIRLQIQELNINFSALDMSDNFSIEECLKLYQEMQDLASDSTELQQDEINKIPLLQKNKRHRDVFSKLKSLINLDDIDYYPRLIEELENMEKLLLTHKTGKMIRKDSSIKIINQNPLSIRYQNTEMNFVKIGAGMVYVGDKDKTFGIVVTKVAIDNDFWLGKYPITNRQFAWFDKTYEFNDDNANKPVTRVSWVRAMEYCEWLQTAFHSMGKNFIVRLPNEVEWEKAAKDDSQKKYPWGNDLVDETFCNFGRKYLGATDVTHFPKGESTLGCWDMAGNVWEWTSSVYNEVQIHIPQDTIRKETKPGIRFVCKGGAWDFPEKYTACSSRYRYLPNTVQDNLGFRILVVAQ